MADNSGAMIVSPQDRDMMIRTVIGEAGSDPSAPGVAAVIANRMRRFGQSARDVVLAPNQFDAWSDRPGELNSYAPTSPQYKATGKIVDGILSGSTPDPTGGATQYYAPAAQAQLHQVNPQKYPFPPPFDDGSGVQIGGHKFFGGQPVADNTPDWLGQAVGAAAKPATAAAKISASPTPTVSAVQPTAKSSGPPPPTAAAPQDWLGQSVAAPASRAGPPSAPTVAPTDPTQNPSNYYNLGSDPDDPRFGPQGPPPLLRPGVVPASPASSLSNVVDPYEPIPQQLSTAARGVLGYVGGQVAGLPGAIATDWRDAGARNVLGNEQMAQGDSLPSFPSADPRTWSPGGVVNALTGVAGQVSAPLTAGVRQFVQDPVTQATGSPAIGAGAGMVGNILAGNEAGLLLKSAAPAVGTAIGAGTLGTVDGYTAGLADLARTKYGIPLTAPQISGNPGINIVKSALDKLPFSGAAANRGAQQDAWMQGVSNTIGENASQLTPDVMDAARKRIGGYFDTVANNTTLQVDQPFIQDVVDVLNRAGLVLTKPEADIIKRQAQNIGQKIDPNSKTISGDTYQALTRQGAPLDNLISSDNPNISYAASGLKNALDDMLQRSAPPDMQDLLSTARRQWASLKTIQPIAAKAPTGDISPALLAGRVNTQTDNGLAFGRGGDLGELARIGQRFMKEPGSSNTAERLLTHNALGGIGKLATAGILGGVGATEGIPALTSMSGPELAATAATVPASLLAGRAISGGLRSNWLANNLINRSLGIRSPSNPNGLAGPLAITSGIGGAPGVLNPPVNPPAAPNP